MRSIRSLLVASLILTSVACDKESETRITELEAELAAAQQTAGDKAAEVEAADIAQADLLGVHSASACGEQRQSGDARKQDEPVTTKQHGRERVSPHSVFQLYSTVAMTLPV